jgi:LysM repeat protein
VASLKAIRTITAFKTKSFQLAVAFRSIAWPFINPQVLLKKSVPSYDLLSELLLKHKSHSHSSSLSELLSYTITLINTSNIIRTGQTEHIKDKTKAITVAEVSKKALKATVASEAVTVSREIKAVTNITRHLHARGSVIFITSQVAGQQNTLLKSRNKHITSLVNIPLVFIRHPRPHIIRAF